MSSTTRLLVLGVVRMFQPVHGYVVRRELLSWRAQEWASVQPGSIYNALKTLTRDGLLEVASTDQVGGRPERTTYRLTRAGEDEFRTLLREEWWTVRPPIDPLMSAISFLGETPRAEAIAALENRAAHIHGLIRHLEFAIASHDGTDSPPHVREMMRLMTARVAAELAWSEPFLDRLRNGEYTTADDPPWEPPAVPPAPGPRARRNPPRMPRGDNRASRRAVSPQAAPAAREERRGNGVRRSSSRGGSAPEQTGSDPAARNEAGATRDRPRRNGVRPSGSRGGSAPGQTGSDPAAQGNPSDPRASRRDRRRRARSARRHAPR
ncbi:MAG TPA: PadR family transcriptional regulator [Kofleriaceae bacterium]|nr:PadR family transcriptional regulator [Kofleriaceae bacterium]